MRPEFVKMLRCPETRQPLTVADEETMRRLNVAISLGEIKNRCGQPVTKTLMAGLIREDKAVIYPIVDEIPILLAEEAISLEAVNDETSSV